jgi:hypothetical protein
MLISGRPTPGNVADVQLNDVEGRSDPLTPFRSKLDLGVT